MNLLLVTSSGAIAWQGEDIEKCWYKGIYVLISGSFCVPSSFPCHHLSCNEGLWHSVVSPSTGLNIHEYREPTAGREKKQKRPFLSEALGRCVCVGGCTWPFHTSEGLLEVSERHFWLPGGPHRFHYPWNIRRRGLFRPLPRIVHGQFHEYLSPWILMAHCMSSGLVGCLVACSNVAGSSCFRHTWRDSPHVWSQ